MKLNLYDWFDQYNAEKNGIPQIDVDEIDENEIHDKVMETLHLQQTPARNIRTRFQLTKLIAAVTAAVVLIAGGTLITAAAEFGGLQQLNRILFGNDSEYAEILEDYYTLPDAEVTNTCQNIDARVVGMVSDANTTYISIEFTALNGLTFPENTSLITGSCQINQRGTSNIVIGPEMPQISYLDETHVAQTFKITMRPDSQATIQQEDLEFELNDGFLLSDSGYDLAYTKTELKRWLGYTIADINKNDDLTAEDMQKVRDNFVSENDVYYYPKNALVDDGKISVTFPFQYTETKTEQFTFNSGETEMQLRISALAASFTWSKDAPIPPIFTESLPTFISESESNEPFHTGTMTSCGLFAESYAVLEDGTTPVIISSGEINLIHYSDFSSYETCADLVSPEEYQTLLESQMYDNYLEIVFPQPVDPSKVTEIYYDDKCIWQRN